MSTLRTTTLKHGSSTVDNLVFDNQGRSTFGNNALFVNAQNGRIGINTLTPAVALDVNGEINSTGNTTLNGTLSLTGNLAVNTSSFVVDTVNDRVGIGTASPQAKLEIGGSSVAGVPSLLLPSVSASSTSDIALTANAVIRSEQSIRNVINDGGDFRWLIGGTDNKAGTTGATDVMRIDTNGNVGIGTTGPQDPLSIVNSAEARLSLAQPTTTGDDPYGSIVFRHNDASNNKNAKIQATREGGSSGANLVFYTRTAGDVVNTDGGEERMRIASNGRVGIGATSPGSSLEISNSDPTFAITDTDTANTSFRIRNANGTVFLDSKFNNGNGVIAFTRNDESVESARIDGSGRLLVGTTSPTNVGGNFAATTPKNIQVKTDDVAVFTGIGDKGSSGQGAVLALAKSRAGAIVEEDDKLGEFRFAGFDGNDYQFQSAIIRAEVDGTPGVADIPGRISFSTTAAGSNNPTERMRIRSDGNIAIGDDGNDYQRVSLNGILGTGDGTTVEGFSVRAQVRNSVSNIIPFNSRPSFNFSGSSSSVYHFLANPNTITSGTIINQYGFRVQSTLNGATNNYGFYSDIASATGRWNFYANGTAQNFFAGSTTVGTTDLNPVNNDAQGVALRPAGQIIANADTESSALKIRRNNNGQVVEFRRNANVVGSITVTTAATAYNESSDYRLKENVIDLTGAIDRVKQLQVRRFNFIADPNTTIDGFLAHEAQTVVPEAVTGNKDEVDAEGNPVYQGIDKSKLVPLLTAALQEALTKIESLESRLAALENS